MRSGALVAAGCLALAVVAAASVVAARRQRELALSPLPTVANGAPRGLAAARAWLAATGRPHRVLLPGGPAPEGGEVLLLVAPDAPVSEAEATALLAHAERGGRLVWAMGARPQPALERALGVAPGPRGSDAHGVDAVPLAPHPLFDGITLRTGGAAVLPLAPAALAVAGSPDRVAAVAVQVGAGEAIVLGGPDALENRRLVEGDDDALLARLASLGPIVFDERHLAAEGATPGSTRRTPLLLAGQALIAAAVLLLAVGRRLGAVRDLAPSGPAPSMRDYLLSLAALYRRAGAERALAEESWRALRRGLERRAAIPARAGVAQAAERLAAVRPAAATALRRAAEARDAGSLLAVARAADAVWSALDGAGGKRVL